MLGRVVHEQMYVVYRAVHLDQLRLEVSANLAEDDFEPLEGIRVKDIFPVLGHEDQMDVELRNAVSTVPNSA